MVRSGGEVIGLRESLDRHAARFLMDSLL